MRGRRWRDTRRAGCRRPASPQHRHLPACLPACLRAARPSMPTQQALPRTSTKQSWKICGRLASQRSLQNPLRLDTETRGPIGERHGLRPSGKQLVPRETIGLDVCICTKHEARSRRSCLLPSSFSHILNDCLFSFPNSSVNPSAIQRASKEIRPKGRGKSG